MIAHSRPALAQKNIVTPSPPTSNYRELFHPPGRFKIDGVSSRHWFHPFLASLYQIRLTKHEYPKKKLAKKSEKKPRALPKNPCFFRIFGEFFFG